MKPGIFSITSTMRLKLDRGFQSLSIDRKQKQKFKTKDSLRRRSRTRSRSDTQLFSVTLPTLGIRP